MHPPQIASKVRTAEKRKEIFALLMYEKTVCFKTGGFFIYMFFCRGFKDNYGRGTPDCNHVGIFRIFMTKTGKRFPAFVLTVIF